MKVLTRYRVLDKDLSSTTGATHEQLLETFKSRTEEILFWICAPDSSQGWRLSEVADLSLLYEFAVKFEGRVEFDFVPVLDVRELSTSVVSPWTAVQDSSDSDLAW